MKIEKGFVALGVLLVAGHHFQRTEGEMKHRKERPEVAPGIEQMNPRWEGILRGDSPLSGMQRMYRRFFALMPAPWRCKFCNAPFKGPVAGTLKWIGYAPSAKNSTICAR